MRHFLKDEVGLYRDVRVNTVLDPVVRLHVLEGKQRIQSIDLRSFYRAQLHAIMEQYFDRKTEAELQADVDEQEKHRRARSLVMFRTSEYQRKCEMYCELFRQDVMQEQNQITWYNCDGDWLHKNYEKINRRRAVFKEELREYAIRYLAKV